MEFHAIIVCGPGKQLVPFSQERLTGLPKPLLPIINKPMVDYALDFCAKAFFAKVTVVCAEEAATLVQESLDEYKKHHQLDIDLAVYEGSESGAVFTLVVKQVTTPNFVILPCDFITNLPPQVLIDQYRNRAESDIGMAVAYRQTLDIEDKKNTTFPKLYTMYTEKLLDVYTTKDVEFHKLLPLRTQMTWRYPKTIVSSSLLNSLIFFCSTDIFNLLEPKFDETYFQTHSILKVVRDLARRSWKHLTLKETVLIFVVPHQATFFRVNSIPVWMEANRHFLKIQATEKGKHGVLPPKDKQAANIGIDSIVSPDSHIGERSAVKRLTVGRGCNIGERVKLTGCVILDNVTIENDVQLENCIIGTSCLIKLKTKLTLCNVELTHEVPQGTLAKNETLLLLSLEGIVDNTVGEEDSDDDDDDSGLEWGSDDGEWDDGGNDDGLFDY